MLPIDWDGNGNLDARDIVTGVGIDAGTGGSGEPASSHPVGRKGCAGGVSCALAIVLFLLVLVIKPLMG